MSSPKNTFADMLCAFLDILLNTSSDIHLNTFSDIQLNTKLLHNGYNFEDAVLISKHLVYEDIYTSFHIRKYEIQINQGPERVTNEIPHLEVHLLRNLDKNGIVMLGSWVETSDVLVGKLTPQMVKESSYAPKDRLLRTILGMRAEWVHKDIVLNLEYNHEVESTRNS
ncbi:hypothetical protein R6Q57_014844 [Mikania cordata]